MILDYAVEFKIELFWPSTMATFALPMMYMDDAIRAMIEIMDAPQENIKVRTGYNLAALSFTVK